MPTSVKQRKTKARGLPTHTTVEEMEAVPEERSEIELAEAAYENWINDDEYSECRDAHLPRITRELYAGYQMSDPDRLVIKTRACRRCKDYVRITLVRGPDETLERVLYSSQPDGYSPPTAAKKYHSGKVPKSQFISEDSFAEPALKVKHRNALTAALERYERWYAS